jgi:hypothetical protein
MQKAQAALRSLTTDSSCDAAKAVGGRPNDYRVSGVHWGGLRLRVMESGYKGWSPHLSSAGKQQRIKLGIYSKSGMGLKGAREAAVKIQTAVLDGSSLDFGPADGQTR